jgi:hypothetical protein
MAPAKPISPLAAELLELLDGASAHVRFAEALADFPLRLRGTAPPHAPHTPWQLLEHVRIAQWDILRYCVDPKHESPHWPEGYWPKTAAPPSAVAWSKSVRAFLADRRAFVALLSDRKRDLLAPIPHATDATLAGEACLLANHNSYHVGQLVQLRRLLGSWKPDRRKIIG